MRKLMMVFVALIFIAYAGPALAKVVVKEVPLTWEQVAEMDGGALFNNLCASCHGVSGKGNGPAAGAIDKVVPDLTTLAIKNDGVYSHKGVQRAITGESRITSHGTIDMPVWGQQFMYVRPGWNSFMREAFARDRIHALDNYINSLQVVSSD